MDFNKNYQVLYSGDPQRVSSSVVKEEDRIHTYPYVKLKSPLRQISGKTGTQYSTRRQVNIVVCKTRNIRRTRVKP